MPLPTTSVPRVSVLMAAYNASRFLAEALDDLLAQTFTDFELVIVDDGSTDATPSILANYAARDPRIVVLTNAENRGLPTSLNRGLEHCRAPLVARADADDRYHPNRLELQVRFLDANPDVGLLSCAIERIDEDGTRLFTRVLPLEDGTIRMRELFFNSFPHPGVMFRKEIVQAVGGYDPSYVTAEDSDLWARVRPLTRAANLEVPLVYYRKHATSLMQTRGPEEEIRSLGVRQRLLCEYLQRPVDIEEAGAIHATYRALTEPRTTRKELRVGRRGLREILRKARKRETPSTRRYFRTEVGKILLQQAGLNKDNAALRWSLVGEAFAWAPGLVAGRLFAKVKILSINLAQRVRAERA